MLLLRLPMTNLKMTVRADCAVSVCSPPLLSIKALAPLVAIRGGGSPPPFGQTSAILPPPQMPASEISKLSFPPAWSAYWLSSGEHPGPTYTLFSNHRENTGLHHTVPGFELSALSLRGVWAWPRL